MPDDNTTNCERRSYDEHIVQMQENMASIRHDMGIIQHEMGALSSENKSIFKGLASLNDSVLKLQELNSKMALIEKIIIDLENDRKRAIEKANDSKKILITGFVTFIVGVMLSIWHFVEKYVSKLISRWF